MIWLDGVGGDITDGHIDGYARLLNENTVLTTSDFLTEEDYQTLANSEIIKNIVELPPVDGIEYGTYLNYYAANKVVLLPVFGVESDAEAIALFEELFPSKEIVPINVDGLYQLGGMLHCVTRDMI